MTIRYQNGIYAIREDKDRPLVGVTAVTRAQIGKPVTIAMHPACRVRLRVECPGFRELEEKYHAELGGPTWQRMAQVQRDDGGRVTHLLVTTSRTGELEALLPPGRYRIRAVGNEIQPVSRSVEIQPGHRVRSLGILDVSPSHNVKQGILPDFWRWNPQNLRDRLDVEDVEARVVYRRREWGPVPRDASGIQRPRLLARRQDPRDVARVQRSRRPGEALGRADGHAHRDLDRPGWRRRSSRVGVRTRWQDPGRIGRIDAQLSVAVIGPPVGCCGSPGVADAPRSLSDDHHAGVLTGRPDTGLRRRGCDGPVLERGQQSRDRPARPRTRMASGDRLRT